MMGKKIAILGFGREGKSVLKFLKKDPRWKNSEITILDKKTGKSYLKNLNAFDLVFRSPGVPYNLPDLVRARRAGVKFSSATDLFFKNFSGKIIGITGTKGKGTTSTLLYKILKAAGKNVLLGGNIGKPALDFLMEQKKYKLAILELSSFQLQDLKESPKTAVVLDVFPDHQDAHLNLREYYESKANIGLYQKKSDKIYFLKDRKNSEQLAKRSRAKKIPIDYKNFNLFSSNNLKMRGLHNFRNAVAAATVAKGLGVKDEVIKKVAANFTGLKHRLEFVRKISLKTGSGISFYNDSASTNPNTTAAAIKSFPGWAKVLIAGGLDKNLNYTPLAKALKNSGVELVVLTGANSRKIYRFIKTCGVKIKFSKNLKDAVDTAHRFSLSRQVRDGVIIFSPGSASFDRFKDYADRGEKFKAIVRKIKR